MFHYGYIHNIHVHVHGMRTFLSGLERECGHMDDCARSGPRDTEEGDKIFKVSTSYLCPR